MGQFGFYDTIKVYVFALDDKRILIVMDITLNTIVCVHLKENFLLEMNTLINLE